MKTQLEFLCHLLGSSPKVSRIIVLNNTAGVSIDDETSVNKFHSRYRELRNAWTSWLWPGEGRMIGSSIRSSSRETVQEMFNRDREFLVKLSNVDSNNEKELSHGVRIRCHEVCVVDEILTRRWLGQKKTPLRKTAIGKHYVERIKLKLSDLQSRKGNAERSTAEHEEAVLKQALKRWQRCDFPFPCSCGCQKRLQCTHDDGRPCSCGVCGIESAD
jgi:hypothetical protein